MESKMESDGELDAIAARYAARATRRADSRYSWLKPDVYMSSFESDRAMLELFSRIGLTDFAELRVLEVGCGSGGNLLRLLRWGFDPSRLVGNELLADRLDVARRRLPAEVTLIGGDACELACGDFDIVLQSTVFSSILDDAFQARLARHMWTMAKPGGGVLWYDFCYDNPRNPDVRGVPVRRIRTLFPQSMPIIKRVTLAPPIARAMTRFSPRLYHFFNAMPLLRTHVLCWIPKQVEAEQEARGRIHA